MQEEEARKRAAAAKNQIFSAFLNEPAKQAVSWINVRDKLGILLTFWAGDIAHLNWCALYFLGYGIPYIYVNSKKGPFFDLG